MRSLRALALVALALALGACQSVSTPTTGSNSSRLDAILASGELRIGTTGDLPPLSIRQGPDDVVGFEIDLATALSEAMGLEPRFKMMPFAELLPSLERGDVDIVIGGMTITPERNARVAFAGPYFISGMSVLAKSSVIDGVEGASDLDNPDRTYAALEGSTSSLFVTEVLSRAKLAATRNYDEAVQMVIDGKADAMIADYLICAISVWRHPEEDLAAFSTPFTIEPLGIALPADSPLLLNLVQNYLNTLENTGLLTRFKARWLADGNWMNEIERTPE